MISKFNQFFLDIARGVLVGAIVWYIVRPNEPVFTRFEDSLDNGREMLEETVQVAVEAPPEQLMMACGAGFILGFMVWMSRKSPAKATGPAKIKPVAKKGKRQ